MAQAPDTNDAVDTANILCYEGALDSGGLIQTRGNAALTQRAKSVADIAPACLIISRPFTKIAKVGILRMLYAAASDCSTSVLTCTKRA